MPDVKTQLKTYLDHVVERVDVEDLYVSTARGPRSRGATREWFPTSRWTHAIATGLLIVVVVALYWISGSTDQIDPAATTPPTITNQPSGLMPSQEDFTWRETQLTEPGLDLIVGDGESFVMTDNGETWTSTDGEAWVLQPEPVRVIHGAAGRFLGAYPAATDNNDDARLYRLAVSDDGARWEDVTPASGQAPHRFEEFRYEGLTVDEILGLHLPEAWNILVDHGPEHPGNPSHVGAVLKVDGRYVTYFYDKETGSLIGAVSEDGLTWETFLAADFLVEWLDIRNDRAISDRHLSERLWSSTFASDGTKILALVGDRSGHVLYESHDGITWARLDTRYLETHPADPFANPVGSDSLAFGIAPMSHGWVIFHWWWPLGPEQEFVILFSNDGENWLPLDLAAYRDGWDLQARVAGDTIFVQDGTSNGLVIGEFGG